MSSIFSRAAVKAVHQIRQKNTPAEAAWIDAVSEESTSPETIKKGCPKNTFLSLVDSGLVRGIPAMNLREDSDNGNYGLIAIEYLKNHPHFDGTGSKLWSILSDQFKTANHNSQMDVVLALFRAGEIVD